MKMTNDEYKKYTDEHSPRSHMGRNLVAAFISGGLICVLGQALISVYTGLGLDAEAAGSAASITLIFLGAALTGFGVYDDLAKLCGAGTLVPITGFANSVAAPAIEFKSEGYITGMAAKMFIIAGPVIVFGVCASMVYGLVLCLL